LLQNRKTLTNARRTTVSVWYQKTLLFPQHNLLRRRHGKDEQQLDAFSYVSPEQRVPQDHPLRSLRAMTDEALCRG